MANKEVNEKVKPLILTDSETGDKYVLEFSRDSVKFAEQRGFIVDEVVRIPSVRLPELFFYAFRKNHRNVSRERTDRMLYEELQGLTPAAVERLIQLYMEPQSALIRAEEDGEPKNARMTVEL